MRNLTQSCSTTCHQVASTSLESLHECECCSDAVGLSKYVRSTTPHSERRLFSHNDNSILDTCPTYSLSILDIGGYIQGQKNLLSGNSASTKNCAILDTSPDSCVQVYDQPYTGKVYNHFNLPVGEPGSEPLTNGPGDSPALPYSTTIFSLFPWISTITLATSSKASGTVSTGKQSSVAGTLVGSSAVATQTKGSPSGVSGTVVGTSAAATQTKSNAAVIVTITHVTKNLVVLACLVVMLL
jgi:hypothetical protein